MFRVLRMVQTLARTASHLQAYQACPVGQARLGQRLPVWSHLQSRFMSGEGEGRGGGGGGSIRRAGGTFGKKEAAEEERYFREKTAREIRELKQHMKETLTTKLQHHQREMDNHKDCLRRHQDQLAKDHDSEMHQWHINHHEQSMKYEENEIHKIKDMWKKLHLD